MIERDSKSRLEERVRRYVARYDERTLATARKTQVRTREARAMMVKVDSVTRGVMDRLSVSSIWCGGYFNFGRKVLSLVTRYTGSTLEQELGLVRNQWMARGLSPKVMEAVQAEVARAAAEGRLSQF
jgi:hypothetical protein